MAHVILQAMIPDDDEDVMRFGIARLSEELARAAVTGIPSHWTIVVVETVGPDEPDVCIDCGCLPHGSFPCPTCTHPACTVDTRAVLAEARRRELRVLISDQHVPPDVAFDDPILRRLEAKR